MLILLIRDREASKLGKSEKWRAIKGFERYEVSDQGRLRSLTTSQPQRGRRPARIIPGRIMTPSVSTGRRRVDLWHEGKRRDVRIAVLVAEAFIPNPDQKPWVCHKDDNKTDDRASNLYWGSRSDNGVDRYQNIGSRRLSKADVVEIKKQLKRPHRYGDYKRLAKRYGVHPTVIYDIRDGERWNHV